MNRLIISANLGRVRVLQHQKAGADPIQQAHWKELPDADWCQPTPPLGESVTDQAGRFSQGGAAGLQAGMSIGEEHELKRHINGQALKHVAEHIESVLCEQREPEWVLVAPGPVLKVLEQLLSLRARKHLVSRVGADLTRCSVAEIQKRFPA